MRKFFTFLGSIAIVGGLYYMIHNNFIQLPQAIAAKIRPQHQTTAIVFSTPTCYWCKRAKEFLKEKGIPYVEKNVLEDDALAEMAKCAPHSNTVPQIIIGGVHIGGYTDLMELDRTGKLDDLVNS
jgi:glutaredoxin